MSKTARRRSGRSSKRPTPPSRSSDSGFRLHGSGAVRLDDVGLRRVRRVALAAIALTALALLGIALGPHRVGDYATETDFYGDYAQGASLIQHGRLDPVRYGVVGPVYESTLALVGLATRNLFLAGELISIAASCATLFLWFTLLERQAGALIALWTTLFLTANPTLFRYGYSVTTDALAAGLQAAALFALFTRRGRRAPLLTGMIAALAALTRYSAVYLLPGALLIYAWRSRTKAGSEATSLAASGDRDLPAGWTAIAGYVLGFALLAVPWLALALPAGRPPGQALFHNIAFDVYARPYGVTWDEYQIRLQPQFHSFADVLSRDPMAVVRREAGNIAEHAILDMQLLLGWPIAAAAAIGLVLSFKDRTWRRLLPLWIMGALLFGALVPSFHSERYSLPLAPIYLTLVGTAAASPRFALLIKGLRLPIKTMLAIGLLAISVATSVAHQIEDLRVLPFEVLPAAETLHRLAPHGGRILTRKPHIAFHSGLEMVPFPAVRTLGELADFCRREKVDFIFVSQPEVGTRPEFTYLLDPSGPVPGLSVAHFVPGEGGVVYRIGPGFGADPEWMASDSLRTLHVDRALDIIQAPEWRKDLISGIYAYERNQLNEALVHFTRLSREHPELTQGWALSGEVYRLLGEPDAARSAFARAIALEPNHVAARLGLGWANLELGRSVEAAAAWRAIVTVADDPITLQAMVGLYRSLGDAEAARAAERELARLGGGQPSP